ncbi:lasso peptide biosynthesis B2 protein (plasmid) [Novosphingobium sp. BL-8A]|uniref:lasso peptide biosynthesis B2 protein n=1 Tax=Novosphingobium sp. BL-8A TaxID=3127639 RepID=UPI0037576488
MVYALPGGLSFCLAGDRLVFLDLPSDRYFCLSPPIEADFRALIEGRTQSGSIPKRLQAGNLLIAEEMVNDIAHCLAPAVTGELRGDPQNLMFHDRLAAIGWILRSRTELKVRGLAVTIQHLINRKAVIGKALPISDAARERNLSRVAASFRMASGIIGAHGQCLPRSLAIAHRLLSLRISPMLILGVRLTPFAAHAWVQVDGMLMNECRERTDVFTPILVV